MASLRDRWRRSWLFEYFAVMAPADRAVALIALLLAAAIATLFTAFAHRPEAPVSQAPRLTAPPFTMDFAAVTK